MSSNGNFAGRDGRRAWKKPSVARVGAINDVRAGAVIRNTEDPFYSPS